MLTGGLFRYSGMPTLIFRCPITGRNVQGWIAEDVPADPLQEIFVSLRCTACSRMHALNPVTAEVLGTGGGPKT